MDSSLETKTYPSVSDCETVIVVIFAIGSSDANAFIDIIIAVTTAKAVHKILVNVFFIEKPPCKSVRQKSRFPSVFWAAKCVPPSLAVHWNHLFRIFIFLKLSKDILRFVI